MKRFHVHISVMDMQYSIRFYSAMFGQEPTVAKDDYAKWMLDDPRINFAISTRAGKNGLDHLGIQVESEAELSAVQAQLGSASSEVLEQHETACCYAKSNKYWVQDPAGIAWEAFHTLGTVPVFGEAERSSGQSLKSIPVQAACCAPGFSGAKNC